MQQQDERQQAQRKQEAALAAIEHIRPMLDAKSIIGVGTGSTTNYFIDGLRDIAHLFDACVASSEASATRLRGHGLTVLDLNAVDQVTVYVDGADEVNAQRCLIKGGGGALTREKIVAAAADDFVCIVDESKMVDVLGRFPLPVEVIPMARGLVARRLAALGGEPALRTDFVTDNGNVILDLHGLEIIDPPRLEAELNNLVGCVCNGLFTAQRPSTVFIAGGDGILTLR
ncbi:MAG: ribose-5-phosphate isomerase RpiA [Pseudomonadota bacterium]